jgi:hypothetical protein
VGEALSEKRALLKAVEREPGNPLPCYALADLLEEAGGGDLAFAYRWMGWYGRRPGFREGKGLRKRFAWYKEEAFEAWPGEEAERYHALPRARLQPLVYQALEANPQFQLYATFEQAVTNRAEGLARLRSLLQPPEEGNKTERKRAEQRQA